MGVIKLKDIADKIGVSVVTVSNALSGKKGVSRALRDEIMAAAGEMGYDISRYNDRKKESRIGVIVSEKYISVGNSFYWAMYQQVAYMASKKDCFTMLEIRGNDGAGHGGLPGVMQEKVLDGLLVIGWLERCQLERILKAAEVPVVLLDFYEKGLSCDSVMSNNYMGMYRATRYLLERGHRDIAFVGTIDAGNNIRERYFGFRRGMEEWRLPIRAEWILGDRDIRSGKPQINLPEHMPTAFVCNSDYSAGYLYDLLQKRGLRVPEDVSVISYDNYLFGHPFARKLTTCNVDMRLMAKTAVDVLLKKQKYPDKKQEVRYIDSVIIERSSVKNLNHD